MMMEKKKGRVMGEGYTEKQNWERNGVEERKGSINVRLTEGESDMGRKEGLAGR